MRLARRHAAALFTLASLVAARVANGQATPAAQAAAATTTPASKWDWTSSRAAHRVGDVVTIILAENVGGTAVRQQSGRAVQSKDLSVDLQTPGGAAPMDGSFRSGRNSSSDESGSAKRGIGLNGTFSVRVAAVGPDGILQLKGERSIDVDGNRQVVTLQAAARPEDISATNTIESTRLADAKIATKSGGTGGTGGGLVGKIVGWIWP